VTTESPPGEEQRPRVETEGAANNITNARTVAPAGDGIPTQLRRRRAASRRLPPLHDGRQDPIDPPRRRKTIQVRAIGGNTVEFVGCDRAVYSVIRALDVKFMRAAQGGAWLVPLSAADELMALLEYRRYKLDVTF
jgi:hypothetical protein